MLLSYCLWNYVGKQHFIFQHENIEDSNFKNNFLTAPIDLTLNYNTYTQKQLKKSQRQIQQDRQKRT